jgi:1-acyl-sn-glycerol-3-phosphate acyltransferase
VSSPSPIQPWVYQTTSTLIRICAPLYFRQIVIQGQEHLPPQGPIILAPKHFSRWDPVILSTLSREPFVYMTNANQFNGIQGWFIQRLGAFPVDLNQPKISSLRYTIQLLHNQHKLVIFPEGGIVRDQPLRTLKTGLARIVLQAEATAKTPLSIPIIPIGISYHPSPSAGASIFIHINTPLYTHQHRQDTDKRTADVLTIALQNSILQSLKIVSDLSIARSKS